MKSIKRGLRQAAGWMRSVGILPTHVDVRAVDGVTAKPLALVIEVLNAAVPKRPVEKLSRQQLTIAEASVYIAYHRVPQAIGFLRELLGDAAVDQEWLEDVIACLNLAIQMPGTDAETFDARRERERKQREYEIKRIGRYLNRN